MRAQPSSRPIFKVSLLVTLLAVLITAATFVPYVMWMFICSVLLAFMLKPIVKYLEFRVGLQRVPAVVGTFLVFGGISVLTFNPLVSWLTAQASFLFGRFQAFPIEQELHKATGHLAPYLPFITADELAQEILRLIDATLSSTRLIVDYLPTAFVILLPIPFLTYFLLAGGDIVLKKVIEYVPNKYFEMTLNVLNKIERDLVGYLRGWILDSVIVGLLSIIGYIIIGADYPILLGSIAGLANLIPYVGPVAGAIPALAISLTQFGDFRLLVPITVMTIIIQILDNFIIQPLSFAQTVDMHPLTVAALLFVGNLLMGVGGMLLAIPVATILKVSARETYWGLKNYRITA
ncbi:MAG TPA: AI-2E family transporter [Bacteroidota bacterium]|nr:AI-2E family transporter [Bacteroidota bacterium]